MKLIVEQVIDLEILARNVIDDLTSGYIHVAQHGQLGRDRGAYAIVREALENVASVTEREMNKDVKSDS